MAVIDGRMAARIDGDFVVFLIGMRVNRPLKIASWLPVARAMPRMLAELDAAPREETGFLGHTGLSMRVIAQYWRSFDDLERYARSQDALHWPAWVEFNRRMKHCRGDVGIWHETYLVKAGAYETLYSGMPPFGLGKAAAVVPATGARDAARGRLGA